MATRISFSFTQREAFEALSALVRGEDFVLDRINKEGEHVKVEVDRDEMIKFLAHKISQVEARADAPKKLTPTQIKNEGVKQAILSNMEMGERYSIPDMLEQFDCFDAGTRSQYVSSLLTQLKTAGKIVRTEEKGKAYFALAPAAE